MDPKYIRYNQASWHLFKTWTRVPQQARTECDRTVRVRPDGSNVADSLPAGKTCETCFRAVG